MFSPGLNSLELNSLRKEYILREKCTNSEGKVVSWFVRDSLCISVSNIRNIDKKFCIETKHETQYFSSELRVTPDNDTLFYEYRSSNFYQIICKESQPSFEPYYIHPHETYSRRVTYDRRTTDGKRANEYFLPYTLLNLQYDNSWGGLDGYIFTETPNYSLATTLSGDTLEYVQMVDKKKQGLMKRTHPDGRIIELINFDNNNLHGEWIAFDGKGDTVFIFNYKHGEKHGLWKTQLEEYTYENGVINGRVRIYELERFFSGLKKLEPVKYLIQDYYMKDGRKHGSYKGYYTDNWESVYVNGLAYEATYFNGMLMGETRSYYPDGTLMRIANYDHDKEHGCFVHYKNKPGDREIQYRYYYEYGQKIPGAEVNCN
jgi:antitoxin component YwqK of YwqJK toxin-antitoxin module